MKLYDEAAYVKNLYTEYFRLVNYYNNNSRNAVFVRYFNVSFDASVYETRLESTYDVYNRGGVYFDLYEYTPLFSITPLLNSVMSVPDLRGQMADAVTTVVLYTIARPRVHDIIQFYDPIKEREIFRVVNVRTPVNALVSDPSLAWYECDCEYAPLKNTASLKVNKTYYYDLALERYLLKDEYLARQTVFEEIGALELEKTYDASYDCYGVDERRVPVELNEAIYYFKRKFSRKFVRLFESLYVPFGYLALVSPLYYHDLKEMSFAGDIFHYYDLDSREIREYRVDKDNWFEGFARNYYLASRLHYHALRLAEWT